MACSVGGPHGPAALGHRLPGLKTSVDFMRHTNVRVRMSPRLVTVTTAKSERALVGTGGGAFAPHDYVELVRDLSGEASGSHGRVVAAYPDKDLYVVESVDESGHTIGFVDAHPSDLLLSAPFH